ncbi:MAG TPA: Fic family protein [Gammaproteobacteria bacterium]|nr:Fic family protein [Gammaproteobacteria bacterium]
MKIPLPPPPMSELMRELSSEDFADVLESSAPLVKGRYLHWDELRHREPPQNLSHDKWWLAIRLARAGFLQSLPFFDKTGVPFRFGMPEPVLIHLHHIDRNAAGQIIASSEIATSEHQARYLIDSLMNEAITSSQLEGAATTRKAAEAMLRDGRPPVSHSEKMIFNNYIAMQRIREIRNEPIAPELIFELHRILTEDTLEDPNDAGRLRTNDEIRVIDKRDGVIIHQPPSFKELPKRLDLLCQFANSDENANPFVHPVIRAILLHFMVGFDHPFVDGNGRTARALFYWSLARSGYWLMEYISISELLKAAPSKYVRAYLHAETDGGDTTYFILHQLAVIRRAIEKLHEYIDRVRSEQSMTEQLLARSKQLRSALNHRQIALITHALKHPGEQYLVETHQRTHGVSYETARTDLLELSNLNILEKDKIGKAFVFTAPDDLRKRIESLSKGRASAPK